MKPRSIANDADRSYHRAILNFSTDIFLPVLFFPSKLPAVKRRGRTTVCDAVMARFTASVKIIVKSARRKESEVSGSCFRDLPPREHASVVLRFIRYSQKLLQSASRCLLLSINEDKSTRDPRKDAILNRNSAARLAPSTEISQRLLGDVRSRRVV